MPITKTAVEPAAWDPHHRIPADTPLTDFHVTGLGTEPRGITLLGLQTAGRGAMRPSARGPSAGTGWGRCQEGLSRYLAGLAGAVFSHNATYHLAVLTARQIVPPPTLYMMRAADHLGSSAWINPSMRSGCPLPTGALSRPDYK